MATSTLLGHLARFASFSMQSEVLCTQALTYLLQTHEAARLALANKVEACTGIGIGESLTWRAETVHDGGRTDLQACQADGVPVVTIEAKLGAELLISQLKSYEADLRSKNSGEAALLVLVPKSQTAVIAQVIINAFGLSGSRPWRITDGRQSGGVVISIISWDELFAALQSIEGDRFQYELEQLQAMYRELSSDFIAPLANDADLRQWESCGTDFVRLVDQVTRRLTKPEHKVLPKLIEAIDPISPERGKYRLRYVRGHSDYPASCYSIGVRDSFAEWLTPVWMRFHKDTPYFKQIRERIQKRSARSLASGGHIWIPLFVPPHVSAEQMVQNLVEQAEKVIQAAYMAEGSPAVGDGKKLSLSAHP